MSLRFYAARVPGQTPLGVFTNINDAVDREACGGWYVECHIGPWRLSVYSATNH